MGSSDLIDLDGFDDEELAALTQRAAEALERRKDDISQRIREDISKLDSSRLAMIGRAIQKELEQRHFKAEYDRRFNTEALPPEPEIRVDIPPLPEVDEIDEEKPDDS